MTTAAQSTIDQARAILAAPLADPSISKDTTMAALVALLATPPAAPAISLQGRLVEVGNLEGGAHIGVTMALASGGFASLLGLTQDQARAAVPLYQREIFIALGGAV